MDYGRTSMDTVSRRTRGRWDEYFKNYYTELKMKDQENGGSGGTGKRARNSIDSEYIIVDRDGGKSRENHDFPIVVEKRGGRKKIEHVVNSGSRRSRYSAGKKVEEEDNNAASMKKRKLDMSAKIDCDGVLVSDEQVLSNGSSLKTEPESRSGTGSRAGNLDEVVSSFKKIGVDSEGDSGFGGRRHRIKPRDGLQMGCDVSIDLENSIDSERSDNSVDSSLSESESASDEDDELSDEDYIAGESLTIESSDDSSRGSDFEPEDDDDNENLRKEEEENLSDIVEDKRTLPACKKNTGVNVMKESNVEQERGDGSYKGYCVDDHGNDHIKVKLKRDDESDKGYHESNDNCGHNKTSANGKEHEDVVIIIDSKEKFPNIMKSAKKNQKGDGELDEYKSSRDEDSCHIEGVAKSGQQSSEKKVKLGKEKSRAAKELDLIKILVESMNASKEQQFTFKENTLTQEIHPFKFRFEDEVPPRQEKSEWEKHIDSLFCDLELGLRESEINCADSSGIENDDFNTIEIDESPAACCARGEHQSILDEQIGIVCKYCDAVIVDIKDVLPPFYIPPSWRRDRKDSDELPSSSMSQIQFPDSASENPDSSTHASGTVWNLIPGVEKELYPHQREGFEFIWKNISGDIIIEKLKQPLSDGRGCIISHAPGTGKTRLTIVFLQTFLKLYPACCPVIIAPRGMLLTWESEFVKWKVDIPFHNLNMKELSGNENAIAIKIFGQVGGGALSKVCIRLLKLYSWTRGGSILGISYKLFEKLVGGNRKRGHHEQIREVLLECPDLLVLDEGHTPRNERSLIWKALAEVETQRRIILSGTPFQNNMSELYNTLCLVNPRFVNQIGYENYTHREIRGQKGSMARKRWAYLTSSIGKNGDDGLKKLRAMLDPFVHVHKGAILQQSLPGLRHTLVFLHPAEYQKTLLDASSKERRILRRIQMVSLVSVHPSLQAVMEMYPAHKNKLEEIESDVDAGVKMKFVMKLIWLADALGERVLIFSQFIDPLVFIRKQIESHLSWNEGRELLYMDGQLDEKQRQDSISSFNDDTSKAKVLLASTKACSEGINLIGASRVILLDTVWNPSVEKQAISRAYRLGQKKLVYVYRLFTSGIEVRQYAQQIKKERISQLIFSPGDGQTCQSENSPGASEDKVLEAMLNHKKFNHIFEKIICQPKESDLIEIFGLERQS